VGGKAAIMSTDTVTLGMQTSREDNRTSQHVLPLRKLLAAHCKGPYSSEVREFALILRIGGEMLEFDFKGCERIRRNKKNAYITVDLGFPSSEWKGQSDEHIKRYLAQSVETGLRCCIERLERDGVAVEGDRLLADYQQVRQQYLRCD
jgi:hypothetical protein